MMMARFFRLVESSVPLAFSLLFAAVGVVAAVNLPASRNKVIGACMSYLVFHTAAMLIVGFYMHKAKKFLALSWCEPWPCFWLWPSFSGIDRRPGMGHIKRLFMQYLVFFAIL
jgi:hypothetical protein